MIAAKDLASQELHALRAGGPDQFVDLVLQSADLGFFHLFRAEFDALVDADTTDVRDDAFAIFECAAREPVKSLSRSRHGLIHVGEQAKSALISAALGSAVSVAAATKPVQYLFHYVSDKSFVDLHCQSSSTPCKHGG
jgi:hypothetical protein